jgi:hypothetical protein
MKRGKLPGRREGHYTCRCIAWLTNLALILVIQEYWVSDVLEMIRPAHAQILVIRVSF